MSSFFLAVCLTIVDIPNPSMVTRDFVDVIELNECFDYRGKLAFRQLIFYQWSPYHRRFQIRETVVVTSDSMLPQRNSISGRYSVRWKVAEQIRTVESVSCRKTKTSFDPEIHERNFLPVERRIPLTKVDAPGIARPSNSINTANRIRPSRLIKH